MKITLCCLWSQRVKESFYSISWQVPYQVLLTYDLQNLHYDKKEECTINLLLVLRLSCSMSASWVLCSHLYLILLIAIQSHWHLIVALQTDRITLYLDLSSFALARAILIYTLSWIFIIHFRDISCFYPFALPIRLWTIGNTAFYLSLLSAISYSNLSTVVEVGANSPESCFFLIKCPLIYWQPHCNLTILLQLAELVCSHLLVLSCNFAHSLPCIFSSMVIGRYILFHISSCCFLNILLLLPKCLDFWIPPHWSS